MTTNTDRSKALDLALGQIEKQFGKGSIMKLGSKPSFAIEKSSSGDIAIDNAMGGGYPKGRIIEIYGPESAGKTTVTLHAIAEVQRNGGQAAFIDAEHALDTVYAAKLGVDIDNLLISQPSNGEEALEIAEALIRSGAVDIIVIDSVAALVPKAEIEGEMGDSHMGLQARLMSQALRKISGTVNQNNCLCIFINQVREKIGIVFGNPETTTGGRALKFYSSVRLEVRKGEAIKKGTEIIGNKTKIKTVKNKIAAPFRTAEVDIIFGEGISAAGSILTLAVQYDIVDKSGSWYSYNGERLGQGEVNVKFVLKQNPALCREIENKVRAVLEMEPNNSPLPKAIQPEEEILMDTDGE